MFLFYFAKSIRVQKNGRMKKPSWICDWLMHVCVHVWEREKGREIYLSLIAKQLPLKCSRIITFKSNSNNVMYLCRVHWIRLKPNNFSHSAKGREIEEECTQCERSKYRGKKMMTKMTMMLFLTDYYVIIHSLTIFSLHFVSSFFFVTTFSVHLSVPFCVYSSLREWKIFISFNRLSWIFERFCPLCLISCRLFSSVPKWDWGDNGYS